MPLKLIQLNIEGKKHISRVVEFLKKEAPDVVCLQEVFEPTLKELSNALGTSIDSLHAPLRLIGGVSEGIAILSRHRIALSSISQYSGAVKLQEYVEGNTSVKHERTKYALLTADIERDGALYRFATTHFTWTPDGEADDFQREDIKKLLSALDPLGELVLTGDFNAPRGLEIWERLASRYRDTVPEKYTSSLDPILHRVGHRQLMVDGIFSTPTYMVTDVEMHQGISDHCALVATVSKAT